MSVKFFQKYLNDKRILDLNIIELDKSARSAQEAAIANKCEVCNIVKSLFIISDEDCVVVLVPGDKRIDFDRFNEVVGKVYRMATADEVEESTGYKIGGVTPFGHKQKFRTYILRGFDKDSDLFASAGGIKTVMKISYSRLVELSGAEEIVL